MVQTRSAVLLPDLRSGALLSSKCFAEHFVCESTTRSECQADFPSWPRFGLSAFDRKELHGLQGVKDIFPGGGGLSVVSL